MGRQVLAGLGGRVEVAVPPAVEVQDRGGDRAGLRVVLAQAAAVEVTHDVGGLVAVSAVAGRVGRAGLDGAHVVSALVHRGAAEPATGVAGGITALRGPARVVVAVGGRERLVVVHVARAADAAGAGAVIEDRVVR